MKTGASLICVTLCEADQQDLERIVKFLHCCLGFILNRIRDKNLEADGQRFLHVCKFLRGRTTLEICPRRLLRPQSKEL